MIRIDHTYVDGVEGGRFGNDIETMGTRSTRPRWLPVGFRRGAENFRMMRTSMIEKDFPYDETNGSDQQEPDNFPEFLRQRTYLRVLQILE